MFHKFHSHHGCNRINVFTLPLIVMIISLLLSGCQVIKPKTYRIGILSGLEFVADITDGFKAGMAELGYVEGENIEYDVQRTEFNIETYQTVLKKFIADKVDLIVVFPTEATIEAKKIAEGTGIPVVFAFALTENMGIIDDIRQPGGNITGVRYPGPDVVIKRFEVMQQLSPNAKRIWLPYQKGYPIVAAQLEALYPLAEAAGITLIEAPADDAAELEQIVQEMLADGDPGIDAILMLIEPLAVTPEPFEIIGKLAYDYQIPLGGALMSSENYGSIFGINVYTFETGKKAASQADKIIKGTPAGTIPVLSAESYLEINYKVSLELGVRVPVGLLNQANKVIR